MKNTKMFLVALAAFANGLVFNYFFVPKEELAAGLAPIDNAQTLVNNFKGTDRYFLLTDDTQAFLSSVKAADGKGEGFVVYYGANKADTLSDVLVAARIDKNKNVVSGYYASPVAKTAGDNCPNMCDIKNGLKMP